MYSKESLQEESSDTVVAFVAETLALSSWKIALHAHNVWKDPNLHEEIHRIVEKAQSCWSGLNLIKGVSPLSTKVSKLTEILTTAWPVRLSPKIHSLARRQEGHLSP